MHVKRQSTGGGRRFFFSEICWGKAMVAYTKPQQRRNNEGSERLRGEKDQIKFIDLRFE